MAGKRWDELKTRWIQLRLDLFPIIVATPAIVSTPIHLITETPTSHNIYEPLINKLKPATIVRVKTYKDYRQATKDYYPRMIKHHSAPTLAKPPTQTHNYY